MIGLSLALVALSGCSSSTHTEVPDDLRTMPADYTYVIGPGDSMEVFVWGNEELTINGVKVRPDGKISTRLVENIEASGKTPSELARDIEEAYSEYVKSAVVSVIVDDFVGVPSQQVRVVGEAAEPTSIPFRKHMTLLDLMVEVGGLTEFAAGNKAVLIRSFGGDQNTYKLRLDDLLNDGDISTNLALFPGDIVIIPEAWF
ncbi:XrtA/PEP-CTERM system exopolysaccharide export protein [uncultured Porticoccus sp.]|uniref:XrtA/PEP-CTERM system exopolysaccharide export protein n=1 Tax=uncultured Porticoccus sp. TaxID=1256050 RepID=UPI0030DBA4AF